MFFGFGHTHVKFFSEKFEKHSAYSYANFKKNYEFINRIIFKNYPTPIAVQKKQMLNIYVLDAIQSYKGVRHSKGLPCRGQRT